MDSLITQAAKKAGRNHLTEKQEAFLQAVYKCDLDMEQACKLLELDSKQKHYYLTSLKDELLELAQLVLIGETGKSIKTLTSVRDDIDGQVKNANAKIVAANSLLDRAGVTRPDKKELDITARVGLFILPAKKEIVINEEN